MRRLEGIRAPSLKTAWAVGLALGLATAAARAEDAAFRFQAPIAVTQGAAFVQLPLPASAYGRSLQAGLADLRVVDSLGERVPYALLAPRAPAHRAGEALRDAAFYPLPARPAGSTAWASPLEVTVQGDRVSVRQRPVAPAGGTTTGTTAGQPSPGWLFDLGERRDGQPAPSSLRLLWSGPAEFSAGFTLETSDNLRDWRAAEGGQVMALASPGGALTQPSVILPSDAGRFVRLVWADASAGPLLTGVRQVADSLSEIALDRPAEIVVAPGAEPAGKTPPHAAAKGSLHFDLGGLLPLQQVDLQLGSGTRVAPVRLQGRDSADQPWRDLAGTVFYQLAREGAPSRSPALPLQATLRYLRVVPDERAAALDATQTRLVVKAALASLVFAQQGRPPFTLLAGSQAVAPSALPAQTLVPSLEQERPRFGSAELGPWTEVAAVAQRAEAEQRNAALRPWLLWAVLLAGVAGLGFMVWRLARGAAR